MTFEEAANRLVQLARRGGGTVTAAQVESDAILLEEPELVSAAARALSGGTNVMSAVEEDGRAWFPYSSLTFSEIYGRRPRRTWRRVRDRP